MKTFDRFTILWIEDNPTLTGLDGKIINDREQKKIFEDKFNNTKIPAISFTSIPKENFRYFNLKVLQHPEEIKEYISLCREIENVAGPASLGSLEGVVPEVVIFDYKLSSNIEINLQGLEHHNIKYIDPTLPIREYINPNHILIKHRMFCGNNETTELFLENNTLFSYTIEDFIKRINNNDNINPSIITKDKEELRDDDLGLFSGIEIARIFNNHICVSLPATMVKSDREKLHVLSKFYEWLNESDKTSMFARESRGSKSWDSLIPDAMMQLKAQIEIMILNNRIKVSLPQLMAYAEGKFPEDSDSKVLSIKTRYGVKNYPLDALFIETEPEERNKNIIKWINGSLNEVSSTKGLLKIIAESASRDISEVSKAKQYYEIVWDSYKSNFLDRILLSDYSIRQATLTPDKKKHLKQLMDKFSITNDEDEISKYLCSVNDYIDYKNEYRLTVLFIATRLWLEHQKGVNINQGVFKSVTPFLTKDDYYNALNPVVNNSKTNYPYTLWMHTDNIAESIYMDTFQKTIYNNKVDIPSSKWDNFDLWITRGERIIVESIFFDDLNEIGYPSWLANEVNNGY